MPFFNKVFLMGYLTQDPVIRSSPSGSSFCSARIAVDRRYRIQDGSMREDTIFISLTIGGRQGDLFCHSLRKGKPVFIEGQLYQHEWTGRNGDKMLVTDVRVDSFRFIDPKGDVTNPSEPSAGAMTLPPLGGASAYRPPRVEPLRRMPEMNTAAQNVPEPPPADQLVDDTPF